ncbi:MAG: hypothetical protein FJ033_11210 [Chloroflexi bacterium]|nr:hypothetical protein [Chloroflexota bacterium]
MPAAAACARCGQGYCEAHRGADPHADWCAECVGNVRVEDALGWSVTGCMLGVVLGVIMLIVTWLVYPPLAQGPGRAFVVIVTTALIVATAGYMLRRISRRS